MENRIFVLVALFLVLTGCAQKPIDQMKPGDMYSGPNFKNKMPEKVTFALYPLPERMDVTDVYLDSTGELKPSRGWNVMLIPKDDRNVKEVKNLYGIRVRVPGYPKPLLQIAVPEGFDSVKDCYLVPVDHAVTAYASADGILIEVADWDYFDPTVMPGVARIKDLIYSEELVGSDGFYDKLSLYEDSYEEISGEWMSLIKEANQYLMDNNMEIGSSITKEQIDMVNKNEKLASRLRKFFGHDWNIMFTAPFIGAPETLVQVFVMKLFKIPEIWNPKEDNDGMRHQVLTADKWYLRDKYANQEYGLKDDVIEVLNSYTAEDLKKLRAFLPKK